MGGQPAPQSWKPLAAYVLPFVVFAALTALEGMESLKPWYATLYSIKAAAIVGVLWWGRKYYPAWSTRGWAWGIIFGLVGGVLWIVLSTWSLERDVLPAMIAPLAEWLNMPSMLEWIKPSARVGFQPFELLTPLAAWSFVAVRLLGLVILVPIMEELFWRGFLNPLIVALQHDSEDWRQVPAGRFTKASFVIITLMFVLAHPEWTAAVVWGIGINVVYWKTKNLWACIIAHAASNAVLGYYILVYAQWHLW